ncbi:MAG: rhodanese-like domain-containing protein [Candidatus Pacebacteria bacterium]|nr:rhodanese-like domain-containing protein [Candidatus Paceibacterota bacterium]MCF7857544.1 rhodanese-like domain-containing protein [Candidatus Paceibacterota bacterium]
MQTITAQELKERLSDGDFDEILIDVREPFEFKSRHIAAAKNIPLDKIMDATDRLKMIKTVYVHCQSGGRSAGACQSLSDVGINVVNIEGGINAWESAGFEVVRVGKNVIPIIRQVMITAGVLILTGSILGTWMNPWWYALSAFVGTGLLFAGVTGICSMTYILRYMPWNRA